MAAECDRYTALLNQHKVDMVCMGIGENGHLAFNDPPVADFEDMHTVKVVELDEVCRQQQVNDGCFATLDEVPKEALTLTIPALLSATYINCVVPGPTKAEAVKNTLLAEISKENPATILRNHPNAVLFLDRDSSRLLNS
ncbi:MAG: 6-phosphogluconolactonase [Pedobacter sp.]